MYASHHDSGIDMTDVSMVMTNKTISRMGAKINEAKGSKISNFARKQMEKMGWKEGEGLGKDSTGIQTHVKAVKREDTLGLGAENAETKVLESVTDTWWAGAFDRAVQKSKEMKSKKKSKKKEKDRGSDKEKSKEKSKKSKKAKNIDDGSKDVNSEAEGKSKEKQKKEKSKKRKADTDGDPVFGALDYDKLFKATGGVRCGMRARASQEDVVTGPRRVSNTNHSMQIVNGSKTLGVRVSKNYIFYPDSVKFVRAQIDHKLLD